MTRVTLRLNDGSTISIVTDEIRCVSVGSARLGPPRIAVHPSGMSEATSYRCPDLWSSMINACKGLEIVDGPGPSLSIDLDTGKEARAEDVEDDQADDENPGPSSRVRACVFCGSAEHENTAGECPALTYTRG